MDDLACSPDNGLTGGIGAGGDGFAACYEWLM